MLGSYGWSSSQFSCLQPLWNQESGWNVTASNPTSGAYGIPQALPGSKMASAGADWQTSAATQIRWGLRLHPVHLRLTVRGLVARAGLRLVLDPAPAELQRPSRRPPGGRGRMPPAARVTLFHTVLYPDLGSIKVKFPAGWSGKHPACVMAATEPPGALYPRHVRTPPPARIAVSDQGWPVSGWKPSARVNRARPKVHLVPDQDA